MNRGEALVASALAGLGLNFGAHVAWAQFAPSPSAMNRPRVGAIGLRYQGSVIAHKAQLYGDITAVCDVDRNVRDQAKAAFGSTPFACEDYRDLISRKDVDVVTIGSPDHWHTKMVIDACRAGEDNYCEKPLTLTIDEGKLLTKVVKETGRVVQVGSWQRSDDRFRQAVELVESADCKGRGGAWQERNQWFSCDANSSRPFELELMAGPDARCSVYRGTVALHISLVV